MIRDLFTYFKSLLFHLSSVLRNHAGEFPPGKVRHQLQAPMMRNAERTYIAIFPIFTMRLDSF